MTADDSHRRWSEELSAYLLDALEPAETEAFERHLGGCERCQGELRWLEPAVDVLPASVPQHPPPPELRGRILATARAEARQARPSEPGLLGRWRPALRPAAALAATAAVAAGAVGYLIGEQEGTQTTTVPVTAMAGTGVEGELVRHGDSAILRLEGLPPLARRQVFQAWLRRGDRLEPSTVFVPQRGGAATAGIPRGVEGADELMVTRERRRGSRRPTSAPLLRASLQ